ncbi:MAG: recombinase family protein [Syntrophales bacterium]|jgi:site-specific DNA recombinase|nr:recombinase family protein [Syntrophales bacterium]MCK9527331.1 recombinase family protein [Syntrophales bacterium]MDX9921199.1 recombinase family protein [Syntrophales bacterium]
MKKKAAGYVRVSSAEQVGGESLSTQRQSIKDYVKAQGWQLTEIYADEGISGGTVKDRHALLQCLYDGQKGKFEVLVIHRLSRFGRNARELLNNHDELSKAGVDLRSISEGIDFGSKYGKAMLGMFAVMSELEREIIREQMLENRIARAKKGIPTSGQLPFGRKFNRETGEWSLDEEKARLVRWAADRYLQGESLRDLSHTLRTQYGQPLGYSYLTTMLTNRCGDTWTITFKDQDPITYTIPRILDDATIQKIRERLDHNKIESRQDVRKYVLTGFIRCEACGRSLSGQTQVSKNGREFKYYTHPSGKYEKRKAFNSVPLKPVENAVFRTIFENIADVPSFERAIADSLPDENHIRLLEKNIKTGEKELKRIHRELDKLVDLALAGTLAKETIRAKEQALLQAKTKVAEELDGNRDQLRSLPDIEQVKREAETIRRQLLEDYSGPERLAEMTFEDKKRLLHWLFDGVDEKGTPYGIYVMKRGKARDSAIDYFLYGKIIGLRTLKGDDIDYRDNDDDEGGNRDGENTPKVKGSYRGSTVYKTDRFTRLATDAVYRHTRCGNHGF